MALLSGVKKQVGALGAQIRDQPAPPQSLLGGVRKQVGALGGVGGPIQGGLDTSKLPGGLRPPVLGGKPGPVNPTLGGGGGQGALDALRKLGNPGGVPLGRGGLQASGGGGVSQTASPLAGTRSEGFLNSIGQPPPGDFSPALAPGTPPVGGPPPPREQFGPDNNLIGTQFNPTASDRLTGIGGQVDTARNNVAGFQPGQFEGIGVGQAGSLDPALEAAQGANVSRLGGVDGPGFGGARGLLGQSAQETAGSRVGQFGGIDAGTFGGAADTLDARQGVSQDLGAIRGGPSRGELASQTFDQIQERGRPGFERELRDVGRKAASLGRIGAGQTTSELNDVFTTRQRDLDLVRQGLSTQSAGQEISDRFNTLGASQGVSGQLFGQDIGEAGFQSGLRGEARGERGFFAGQAGDEANRSLQRAGQFSQLGGQESGLAGQEFGARFGERGFQSGQDQRIADNSARQSGLFSGLQGQEFRQGQGLRNEARDERFAGQNFDFRNLGAQQDVLGQLSGIEGQQVGRERGDRNELRGERGFQTGLDQQNIQNQVQRQQLEEALLNGQFGRDFDQNRFLAGIGFGGNSVGNFGNQAGQFAQSFGNQANASNQAAAAAARAFAQRRGGQPPPPDPRTPQLPGG